MKAGVQAFLLKWPGCVWHSYTAINISGIAPLSIHVSFGLNVMYLCTQFKVLYVAFRFLRLPVYKSQLVYTQQ